MTRITMLTAVLGLISGQAAAFTCTFSTECFEAEACSDSGFAFEVFLDEEQISTEFGDLTIVALKDDVALITLFATGPGAEYMMSVTPDAARFTSHMNEGPMSISYLGVCDAAF